MQKKPLENRHLALLASYQLPEETLVNCECWAFKPREVVLEQGFPIEHLMVVVSGKSKVCSAAQNGKHALISYYISEGILGDIELMTKTENAISSVIALSEFVCIAIPYKENRKRLLGNLGFMNVMAERLSHKLVQCSSNLLSTALYSGEQRLCTYILQMSYKDFFMDNLAEVASSISISYRHLLRLLQQLCGEGILCKQVDGFQIIDKNALISRGIVE